MLLKEAKYHYNSSYWLYNVHVLVQYTKTKVYGSQKYIGLKLVLKEHSYIFASFGVVDKAVTRFTWAGPKTVSFSTARSWEKDTIFCAAQTNFRPFLFWQGFSCFCLKKSHQNWRNMWYKSELI